MQDIKKFKRLYEDYLAMESESAREAGTLGFVARSLVLATMPHRKIDDLHFQRKNGDFSLTLMAHPDYGLPYGSLPRLLMTYLTTEAIRTGEREILLGDTLSDFMAQLGEVPTGGRWGSITRVKNQTMRLFNANASIIKNSEKRSTGGNVAVASKYDIWWDRDPDQGTLFENYVKLSEEFYEEVSTYPVPIDLRAIKALKKSPMALDIYTWITYRMSYLDRVTAIPWPVLETQFGSEYKRTRAFKEAFLKQLKAVQVIYPELRAVEEKRGLIIKPSPTHIPKKVHNPVG